MELRQILVIFGKNVKARREALGLTQGELAILVGQKQSGISRYEKGEVPLGLEVVHKIAEALNCNVLDLLDQTGKEIPAPMQSPRQSLETALKALGSGEANLAEMAFPGIPPELAQLLRGIRDERDWQLTHESILYGQAKLLNRAKAPAKKEQVAQPSEAVSSRRKPRQ